MPKNVARIVEVLLIVALVVALFVAAGHGIDEQIKVEDRKISEFLEGR